MTLAQLLESKGIPCPPAKDENNGFAFSTEEITRRLHNNRLLTKPKSLSHHQNTRPKSQQKYAA
jgi:hypothetical protein